jgi:hypothetical protein
MVIITFLVIGGYFVLVGMRGMDRHPRPAASLKQIGLGFHMYAWEDPERRFPSLAPYEGILMFDIEALYPEYFNDLKLVISPHHPNQEELQLEMQEILAAEEIDFERVARIAAESFTYTGWTTGLSPDAAPNRFTVPEEENFVVLFDTEAVLEARDDTGYLALYSDGRVNFHRPGEVIPIAPDIQIHPKHANHFSGVIIDNKTN